MNQVSYYKYKNDMEFYQNQKNLFFERNGRFNKFRAITEERKLEIEGLTSDFLYEPSIKISKLYQLYYYLNDHIKLAKLHITCGDEVLLFLLLSFDPELKLLQMYYEESKKEELIRRFKEEFNCLYDSRILTLEKYYNERFPTIVDEFTKSR